jgi:hypothetical protein
VSVGRSLRVALAGTVAAGVWAAVEPLLSRATGGYHRQARLIGGLVAPDGPWRATGLAVHLANGAAFGIAFDRLGGHGVCRGVLAAEAENALLWPLVGVIDRIHPDVRSGRWPPLERNPHAIAQEVLGHAVFGAVLGGLLSPGDSPRTSAVTFP